MRVRTRLAALLAGWLVALAAFAQAPDQTLFGPQQYLRTTGAPNTYTGTFSVPASAGTPFQLRIVNGAANGQNRISSGWVKVNGVQVVGPADFSQNVALIERSLNLSPSNTLEVRLASAPGGYITLTVLGTRILPVPTALTPSPITITAGAIGMLTATLSPAPTGAGALAVSSANAAVATVPQSVPFAAGQTSVQIPVNGVAEGSTSVTASANGGSASAAVNVTPAPPTIAALAPAALAVTHGSSGTLTVTISAAQPGDTTVAVSSSHGGIASVPPSVTVPAGQLGAPIAVSGLSPGDATVTASLNGTSASSQVTVSASAPTVVSLVPVLSSVALGGGTSLRLTISSAQSADTSVALAASPAAVVSVPAQAVVPAGALTVLVPVATVAYGQAGITASLNGSSASAVVNVVPPPAALRALEPPQLAMTPGTTSLFTVRINAAQTTNTEVLLASGNPSVLQVPASVSVAQGATSATFSASALAEGLATITASVSDTTRTASVQIAAQAAAVVSLLPAPLPLQQGATGSATVTLNAAQPADTVVQLTNSAPSVATIPASVTVAAGALSVQVPVNAVSPGTTELTASLGGSSASASVEVAAPAPVVATLQPSGISLPKGTPTTLRVTLSRAPNIATAVALTSTDPGIASVPAQVNVPAGALFAEFPAASNAVGQATITASLNGGSASSAITVAPAEPVALTLSPQQPTNYVGEAVPFTATGTMTDGASEDFTTRVAWSSSNTAVATIEPTGLATALAEGQTTITASFSFTAVENGASVTLTQSTVLMVKTPTPLVLTAPTTTPVTGDTVTVTVTTSDPPPFGGLIVLLSGAGSGAGTFPSSVLIPEYQTSATFDFTATAAGSYTITAMAQNRLPGTITFTIQPALAIIAIAPASGEVGTLVTITGSGFDPVPASNQLVFRAINNTTASVAASSASATQITVKVPPLAESGPISLTNSRGTVQSPPFTVIRDQDFQLVISPASLTVHQGASNSFQAQLSSVGAKAFTGLVSLSVQGLPANVAPSFAPQTLSALQAGTITLGALATAPPGTYPITIAGEIKEAGALFTRTANATLTVLASTGVTGVKGRFIRPDGSGIAGIIVRADIATSPQPQTTTDAAGNFVLAGLAGGQITLRFDATPANPLYPIWPQTITVPANKVLVMEDWIIAPPPPDERFSPIQINSPVEQVITDPRFPGLRITIPPNTNIVGWDGVPKSRIAVERLDPDKLPVAAPPIKTKSVYQLYFGTPMGGLPSNPIPVTLPNDLGLEPGRKTPLWYYDGSPMGGSGEWKQGGTGTVSADGSVIIADPGSGIPRFCGVCGLPCFEAAQNEAPNQPCCDDEKRQYGKPVTLATGQELESAVDLVLDGEVPIVIRRVFNPFDGFAYIANFQQSLGVNWTFGGYDVAMLPFAGDHRVRLVLPGNSRVDFLRGPDGTFRSGGYSTFDGADMFKVGGTNPSSLGALTGGHLPPGGAPLNPTCIIDGSFYILRFKDGRDWRFDAAPNATKIKIQGGCLYFLSEMRDAQGRFVKIHRSDGKIQRIETSSGQWVNFGYGNGVVSSVTDSAGRTVTYNHEFVPNKGGFRAFGATTDGTSSTNAATESAAIAAGLIPIPPRRLTSAVTPEGTYAYTYEDDPPELRLGALSFDSGTGGAISLREPNCQNVRGGTRLKTIQLPGIPGVFTNFYGPSKRVLRQTWPDGTDIRFSYKVVGGCVPGLFSHTSQPTEGTPISGGSDTTTCQGAGCIRIDSWEGEAVTGGTIVGVDITDSRGKKFGQDFNTLGLATKVIDENGQEVTIVRSGHRILSRTDSLGRTTSYTYDARGNRTRIVDPAGRETSIAYDAKWNKPTLVSRRLDADTVIEYRYSYDPATGVLRTSTDPENNVTTYDYDINNRLALIRDPLQHQTAIQYDGQGNPSRIVDALGNAIEMISDATGRIIRTTDALSNETRASYNPLNQLTSVTDALQGETRFNFDSRNNLASVVNPLNNTIESYGYDAIGRLSTKTDAHLRSETYGYDGNGNLTSIIDRRNQTTGITYNARNQPSRIAYHDGTAQERTYDAAGRLTEIREGDNAQRMEYDILDRVTRVVTDTLAGLTSIAYEYDALDRRTKRTVAYPGGVLEETVYAYDKASRLTSITQTGVNGTQTTLYAWDAASRLTQKTLPNGIRQEMAYDDANRLLSITYRKTDDSILEFVEYTYDANGQRTVKSSGSPNLQDTTFTAAYDAANRMTAITLHPGTPSQKTYNLTYDDHGNLVQKQNVAEPSDITIYTWDARNRLTDISMTEGGQTSTAAFRYDALGRRVERTISQGASFQRTQYVYDGIQAIGELVDGRLAATILTGLNIDEVIARTVNVGGTSTVATKSYVTDALGSVLAMTLENQNPEVFYSYSAYGETNQLGADPESPANSSQYTARESDGLVGGTSGGTLYYYRARYYDPVLKRFVAEDPIGLWGSTNFSQYVNANPVSFTDPLGLVEAGQLSLWDVWDSIVQGTSHGWNSGYYSCFASCMGGHVTAPLVTFLGEKAAVHTAEHLSGPGARVYYTWKYPKWFKAGGAYSRVYVPNVVNTVKTWGGRAGILAVGSLIYGEYECAKKCMDCL